jgi:hypothetical protein
MTSGHQGEHFLEQQQFTISQFLFHDPAANQLHRITAAGSQWL